MVIKIKKKKIILITLSAIFIIGVFFVWSSLIKNNTASLSNINNNLGGGNENEITVFKSLTCDCCAGYVDYLKREGFKVQVENVQDMLSIKEKYQVPPELESCHTATIGNYFIEGHVPIEAIKKLFSEKPDILGIALPGMPSGSPGMGGVKKGEFKIQGLSRDGTISEFMSL